MVSKQRSYNMSRIKSKDTSIELKVRKYLYHKGYRYQKMLKLYLEHQIYTYQNIMLLFLLTVVFGIIITIVTMPIFLKQIKNFGLINLIKICKMILNTTNN